MKRNKLTLSIIALSLMLPFVSGGCFDSNSKPNERHSHNFEIIDQEVGFFGGKEGECVKVTLKCTGCDETKYEYHPYSEFTNLLRYAKSTGEESYVIIEVINWVDPILVIPDTYKGLPIVDFQPRWTGNNNVTSIVTSKNLEFFSYGYFNHIVEIIDNYDVISEYNEVYHNDIDIHKGEPNIEIENGFVFYNKNGVNQCVGCETFPTSKIVLPDYYKGTQEYEIRYGAFGYYREVEGVHVGEGVYKIENYNFSELINIEKFELPDRYIEIEEDYTYNHYVYEQISKGNDVYINTTCLAAVPKRVMTFREGTKNIAKSAFNVRSFVFESITFPDSLLYLGGNQLDECNVGTIIFNSSLKKIGKEFFIPDIVSTTVARAYFFGPTDVNGNIFSFRSFTEEDSLLYMPKGVNNIGTTRDTPTHTIYEGTFDEYLQLDLTGPIASENIYFEVTLTKDNYEKFTPYKYKEYRFDDEYITLSENVTIIKPYVFAQWNFIKSITGKKVTTVSKFAFAYSSLEEFRFISLNKIGSNAFTEVYIERFNDFNNLGNNYIYTDIELASHAFACCYASNFRFIKRDSSSEDIEYDIPEYCFSSSRVEDIYFKYQPTSIGERAFTQTPLKTFFVSNDINYIGFGAFYSCYDVKLLLDENLDTSNFDPEWDLHYVYFDGSQRIDYHDPYPYSETYAPHSWHYSDPKNKDSEKLLWDPEPEEWT